jgi:hypothetical protein
MKKQEERIKKIKKAIVVLSLHSPKEKIWGLLLHIDQAGAWIHGIDINSFDDWSRQVATQKEPTMGLSTMFFPMIRLEKIIVDETVGTLKSFSMQFYERAGFHVEDSIKLGDLSIIPFINV